MVRNFGKAKVAGSSSPLNLLPARFEQAKTVLRTKLQSKVELKVNRKGAGSIVIAFKSGEDFDRIISKLDS